MRYLAHLIRLYLDPFRRIWCVVGHRRAHQSTFIQRGDPDCRQGFWDFRIHCPICNRAWIDREGGDPNLHRPNHCDD